jgi:hypothetical protein
VNKWTLRQIIDHVRARLNARIGGTAIFCFRFIRSGPSRILNPFIGLRWVVKMQVDCASAHFCQSTIEFCWDVCLWQRPELSRFPLSSVAIGGLVGGVSKLKNELCIAAAVRGRDRGRGRHARHPSGPRGCRGSDGVLCLRTERPGLSPSIGGGYWDIEPVQRDRDEAVKSDKVDQLSCPVLVKGCTACR